jgi:hypothetical protein
MSFFNTEVTSSASTSSTGVLGALPSPGYYFEASIDDGATHVSDDGASLTNDEGKQPPRRGDVVPDDGTV